MKSLLTVFVFCIIFFSGCQNEEYIPTQNDSQVILEKVKAPFFATLKGQSNVNCQTMTTVITGSGYTSFLGNYTSLSTGDLVAGPNGTGTFINGVHTATNPYGYQFTATWTGSWQVVNPTTFETHYILKMKITGGTGPFEGASGSFEMTAIGIGNPCGTRDITTEMVSGYIEFNNLVPFKAVHNGTTVGLGACTAGPLTGQVMTVSTTGNISHFGNSTVEMIHCNTPTSLTGGLFHDGDGTITAANGDEVFIDYSGFYKLNAPYPNMTSAELYSSGIIVGGTGRFEGATGTINCIGVRDLVAVPSTVNLNVTAFIRY